MHTVHECKYHLTVPVAIFIGAASSENTYPSSEHRHVDTAIANAILKQGTRNSFHLWPKQDYDLDVTMLQIPQALGGFGLTPNVLAQSTAKVAMSSRFLGFVGSSPPDEQNIWLPHQLAHDPQTWLAPNLLQLKTE